MTLLELYELVDELLAEFEEDTPVKMYNPITDTYEEIGDIIEVELTDGDSDEVTESFLSIQTSDSVAGMDPLEDDEEG
jgi:hypothetical protein